MGVIVDESDAQLVVLFVGGFGRMMSSMILTRLILVFDTLFYGMVYFHSMYPYISLYTQIMEHRRLKTHRNNMQNNEKVGKEKL